MEVNGLPIVKLGEILPAPYKNGIYKHSDSYGGGTRILRITDFDNNGKLVNGDLRRLELTPKEAKNYRLQNQDIVVNRVNSLTHLGKSTLWNEDRDVAVVYESNMMRIEPDTSTILPEFLIRILQSHNARSHFRKVAKRAVAQCSISQQDVKSLKFPLPPVLEQKKIAQILSTWDQAITASERLLENSQQRKKGLMQQLLTGKKRLPGFEGVWERSTLTQHCSVVTGNRDLQNKVEGGKYPFFVRSSNIERIDSYSFDGEAILIPGDGRVGEIFHYINGKFDFHQRVYKLSDFRGALGLFIYYYLKRFFKAEVIKNSVKATVDSLRMPVFTGMLIKLPSLEEQQSIVGVLSCSDREVQAISERLDLLKQEKKALMQQLLTGKRRVNVDTEVA
ncbi:MAG: hypothetical protein GYB15_14010 [Gammaproteobacteria bacterium]|nr:hypothetical protein [Gammaproteobacteria bacterium]